MTFTEAMDAKCESCGLPAKTHRLTLANRFYCLSKEWNAVRGLNVYRCPVKYLKKSPLSSEVGEVINASLSFSKVNLETMRIA